MALLIEFLFGSKKLSFRKFTRALKKRTEHLSCYESLVTAVQATHTLEVVPQFDSFSRVLVGDDRT